MRIPPDDGADQPRSRRRDRASRANAAAQQSAEGGPDRESDSGRSVFTPGFESGRRDSGGRPAISDGTARPAWYGTATDGSVGKGPVRGYPPSPGQPPPMYPPGQFSAWNRRSGDRQRPAAPGSGDSGQFDQAGQPQPAAGYDPATSGYYSRDTGPGAEPGYSMLAVSDPAADVTSTQTWSAVGEGRSTGTWTTPVRPGSEDNGASGPPPLPHRVRPDQRGPWPDQRGPRPDQPGHRTDPADPRIDRSDPRVDFSDSRIDLGSPRVGQARQPGARNGQTGPLRTDSQPLQVQRPATGDSGTSAAPRRQAHGHSGAHTGPHTAQRSRRKRPASVKLALACALVLVLGAAAALYFTALRNTGNKTTAPPSHPKTTAAASPSPTPTLGPNGHIGSRAADPTPLTVAQLYPASFTDGGATVTVTRTAISRSCSSNLVGANIQAAASSAGCDQVVRATYLYSGKGLMGTIGVLNLSTANGAKRVAQSADASDFISQLKGRSGATRKIGQGTGIEEAAAKGHYLILIWAEFASLRKPKTAAQRTEIEQFMTELLDQTANVSLSQRMLTGTP